jgi:hypothetical protein
VREQTKIAEIAGKHPQQSDKKKLTAADLDQVRRLEGFPLGRDEEIIKLSDPPYYTACPNPFLLNFIDRYGKPFDSAADNYRRKPLPAPEGTPGLFLPAVVVEGTAELIGQLP